MEAPGDAHVSRLKEALFKLKGEALERFKTVKTKEELLFFKSSYLGKKGELKKVLSSLGDLPKEERAFLGKVANDIQSDLLAELEKCEALVNLQIKEERLKLTLDSSIPGREHAFASLHPLTQCSESIVRILERLGFVMASGPEIEHDFYNFEALNIPKSHPARDMQDTFYINDEVMLRTHTSPVQIRAMIASKKPPLKVMSLGNVYRRDEDLTHSPMFTQVEGLYIDEHVSLADLKATLAAFAQGIFAKDSRIRMRPSFFPFTEPSMEVDVSCFSCAADVNCRLCKGTGWIEILGAGMVDPEVFHACGYDSEKYRGFAFGMGVERIAMLRYGIPDIRLFYENDLRFLRQF
jgi:phenylalanyl-tRNA synthetase alpha chain